MKDDKQELIGDLADKLMSKGTCELCGTPDADLAALGPDRKKICHKCGQSNAESVIRNLLTDLIEANGMERTVKAVKSLKDLLLAAGDDAEPCDDCGKIHPPADRIGMEMNQIMQDITEEAKEGPCSHCGDVRTLLAIGPEDALVCKPCSVDNHWIKNLGKKVSTEMQRRHPEIKVAAILVDPENPEETITEALNDTTLDEEERVSLVRTLRRSFLENRDLQTLAVQETLRRSLNPRYKTVIN